MILVRHGETAAQADNRYVGTSDIALAPAGREQAEELGRWAAQNRLDALWSSTLRRALETAAVVARHTGLEPRTDARLRELDFGEAEGHTLAEMQQLYPQAVEAFRFDPVKHPLPGGEDPREAVRRAMACLEEVVAAHPTGRVLLVAHNTLIRLVLCELLGLPLSKYRLRLGGLLPCARASLELGGEAASLLEFNVAPGPYVQGLPGPSRP
ncbi:MAG: histidine phosphatase family protein [Actinomycetota bacterium]|nr:histidine phosphatase family protein [Actinomycetota bacterium]